MATTSGNRGERRAKAARERRIRRELGSDGGFDRYRQRIAGKSERVPIGRLKPYPHRSRTHSDEQLAMVVASFEAFGLINPLIVDENWRILAGHARWEAAKELGYAHVPVVRVAHLSEDEKRAYVIADNRIAEKAGWDFEVLAIELEHLASVDLGFEVDVTGFSIGEIDLIIGGAAAEGEVAEDPADEVGPLPGTAVSQPGDLWRLGRHRLVCGNALEAASYDAVLAGAKARLALTDAPYNLPIGGFVSGLGRNAHREFAMASGEMSEAEFVRFLTTALDRMRGAVVDGGLIYAFMDWRHTFELQSAARALDLTQLNLCVWDKQSGGMGSLYRSQHELCFVFRTGDGPHRNNVELGRHGRTRTNVWSHPGLGRFGRGRDETLAMHPTVKPVALLAEAIMDCSKRGEVVLDPFCGSGSTLIAAERTGRTGCGIELDALYVDTAIRRWEKVTGGRAVHAATGIGLDELGERRAAEGGVDAEAPPDASVEADPSAEDATATSDKADAPGGAPGCTMRVRTRPRPRPASLATREASHG